MKTRSLKLAAADIAQCGLFVALMCVAAFIKIPFPFVPLTFQTAVALSCGFLIGWKKGVVAMSAYALCGVVGIPVFASEPYGGFGCVLTPSFGFVLGFIVAAGVAGACAKFCARLWQRVVVSLCALLANYLIGTAYFIAVWLIGEYGGLWHALTVYVLAYLPKDVLIAVLAAVLAHAVFPLTVRSRRKSVVKNSKAD